MFISKAPKYLQKHPQYTNSDYGYFRRKGWKNKAIKEHWDKENAVGKKPCIHGSTEHLPNHDDILEAIAIKHLRVETLKTRNSDSLDFYDQAVWQMEAALKAAFEAGQQAR